MIKRLIIIIVIIMTAIMGLSACNKRQDSGMPHIDETIDDDYDLTLYDPEEQWLPYTISISEQPQGWLSRYMDPWENDKPATQTDSTVLDETSKHDMTGEYFDEDLEDLPPGFPAKLVPIYKFMEISQSGLNEDTNAFFFYYTCDAPYEEIISFYQDQFSGQSGFTEEDDLDTHYILCTVHDWQVRVNICDFFGGDTAYVEIDVQEGE